MPTLLAFDTSTEACSCAVLHGSRLEERFELIPRQHTQFLLPMIHAMLNSMGLGFSDLDAVAFGKGPGSFTGLRIAAGVAQGIAFAADLPVIGVSTLAALAMEAAESLQSALVFSCLDARIDEIYSGWYQISDGKAVLLGSEQLCRPELLSPELPKGNGPILAAGNGLQFRSRLPQQLQAGFETALPLLLPRSRYIVKIASQMWERKEMQAPDAIEPVYLRDKVTQTPKQ